MERREIKWLRRGCLGCLALVGLGVLAVALLLTLPLFLHHPTSEPVNREFVPDLPPAPQSPPPPDSPSPEGVTLPPEMPPEGLEAVRLRLDLSAGSFSLEPGPPGEPLRVEADYDAGRFALDQRYDQESHTYNVRFGLRGGWLGFLHGSVRGDNRIRIRVPPDRPIALSGDIGVGQSDIELGGLWITDVNLDLGPGEHELRVSEPLRQPLDRIRIDASMGEVRLRHLGNASPERLDVDQGVGEMMVDLLGSWRRDARVDIDLGVGECRVVVPEDVGMEVRRSSVGIGESRSPARREAPEGAPTLTLRLSGGIGELHVESD